MSISSREIIAGPSSSNINGDIDLPSVEGPSLSSSIGASLGTSGPLTSGMISSSPTGTILIRPSSADGTLWYEESLEYSRLGSLGDSVDDCY